VNVPEINFSITIAGIRLDNPLVKGSGVLDDNPYLLRRVILEGSPGGIVTKSITVEPREGYNPPILVPLPTGGYINAIGLANPGINSIPELVRSVKDLGKPVIVSIAGKREEEYAELAKVAEESGASGIELNLSCPHVKGMGLDIGSDPKLTYSVVSAVASTVKTPVIVKVGAVDNVIDVVGKALEAGANGITAINTVKAMYIDVYTFKPVLTAKFGGLSGQPIHPIAVRVVYTIYAEYGIDIMGCGGVYDWRTAIELALAGAKAVQVVSAIIDKGPKVFKEIKEGIVKYMNFMGFKKWDDIVGLAHKK